MPFYNAEVTLVTGTDPSPELLAMAAKCSGDRRFEVRLIKGPAEALPCEDHSFDTVVTTMSLTSGLVERPAESS